MSNQEIRIFENLNAMVASALQMLLEKIQETLEKKDRCVLVLAGGRSPGKLYVSWAKEGRTRSPWDRLHIFWGDERYVPPTHPASNYRMVTESLLQNVPIPESNIHPIPTDLSPIEQCADVYEEILRSHGGADIALLGVGPDGHTASIFPGDPVVKETERWVVAVPEPLGDPPLPRVTLTLPALSQAYWVFFWVAGASKRPVVRHLLRQIKGIRGTPALPAFRVNARKGTLWFIDPLALPDL